MTAYHIKYKPLHSKWEMEASVDARDVKSAKNKIERKIKDKIKILDISVVGYY